MNLNNIPKVSVQLKEVFLDGRAVYLKPEEARELAHKLMYAAGRIDQSNVEHTISE